MGEKKAPRFRTRALTPELARQINNDLEQMTWEQVERVHHVSRSTVARARKMRLNQEEVDAANAALQTLPEPQDTGWLMTYLRGRKECRAAYTSKLDALQAAASTRLDPRCSEVRIWHEVAYEIVAITKGE